MGSIHRGRSYSILATAGAILLWLFNHNICNAVFSDDLMAWWNLKQSIYNLCIVLLATAVSPSLGGYYKLSLDFFIGLLVSSVIDRLLFNSTTYTTSDALMVLVNIAHFCYGVKKMKEYA